MKSSLTTNPSRLRGWELVCAKLFVPRSIGGIVVFQKLHRDRVQPVGGNDVAREGLARVRIVDDRRGEQLAEVAGKHLRRRYGKSIQYALPATKRLIIRHEEQFV